MINWLGLDNNVAPNGALFVWGEILSTIISSLWGLTKIKQSKKKIIAKLHLLTLLNID